SVSAPSSVTNTSPCWNGFIVPGSTLRYGSSFCIVTLRPRSLRRRPRLEAVSPLPRLEATPPVTNTCLVCAALRKKGSRGRFGPRRRTASGKCPRGIRISKASLNSALTCANPSWPDRNPLWREPEPPGNLSGYVDRKARARPADPPGVGLPPGVGRGPPPSHRGVPPPLLRLRRLHRLPHCGPPRGAVDRDRGPHPHRGAGHDLGGDGAGDGSRPRPARADRPRLLDRQGEPHRRARVDRHR